MFPRGYVKEIVNTADKFAQAPTRFFIQHTTEFIYEACTVFHGEEIQALSDAWSPFLFLSYICFPALSMGALACG